MIADSATPADFLEASCALVGVGRGVDISTTAATVQTLFASGEDAKALASCFETTCREKRSCDIEMNDASSCFPPLTTKLAPACLTTLHNRSKYSRYGTSAAVAIDPTILLEPVFLAQATCTPAKLAIPLIGGTVSKDNFGMLIVVLDLAAIMIIVCFIYALDVG